MAVNRMQHQLQQIYDLTPTANVRDFLITSNHDLKNIEADNTIRPSDEKLLIQQQGDDLYVSLYIAEELLDKLEHHDPFERLDENNLPEFCVVLEGVSHFVYLCWNANYNRSVTQLDLELQAEVDKFVSIYTLSNLQGNPVCLSELDNWLFNRCHFSPDLGILEFNRYQKANDSARRFCRKISPLIGRNNDRQSPCRELKRFYRRRNHDKLDSVRSLVAIPGP